MRSMGEITQSAAKPMASLARRGTCGSWRSRRVIVTQAGRKPARSRRIPGGSRRARTTRTTHEAIQAPVAISRMRIMRSTPAVLPCGAPAADDEVERGTAPTRVERADRGQQQPHQAREARGVRSAASPTTGSEPCSTPASPTGTYSPPSHPAETRSAIKASSRHRGDPPKATLIRLGSTQLSSSDRARIASLTARASLRQSNGSSSATPASSEHMTAQGVTARRAGRQPDALQLGQRLAHRPVGEAGHAAGLGGGQHAAGDADADHEDVVLSLRADPPGLEGVAVLGCQPAVALVRQSVEVTPSPARLAAGMFGAAMTAEGREGPCQPVDGPIATRSRIPHDAVGPV